MKGIKKIWSAYEIESLRIYFPSTCNKELAKKFNCGWRTIVRKAREIGLEKDKNFRNKIDFSSFGKGNTPWNKGKKGLPMVAQCIAKQFRKGNQSIMKNREVVSRVHTKRNATISKEKMRLRYGLPQKTKLKLVDIW